MDMIEMFDRATAWTATKVAGARDQLDAPTPCSAWTVGQLLDHLLTAQVMFAAGPAGGTVAPSRGPLPEVVGEDPVVQYEQARRAVIDAYAAPGVLDRTLPSFGGLPASTVLGIAFCDQLVHGWDLARATGQDEAMPPDLAALGRQLLEGRIQEAARGPGELFAHPVEVPPGASDQDELVAYCGRTP